MSLKFLLLALLADHPQSGYEMDRDYSDLIQFFWSAQQRQIYNVLNTLRSDGLAEVEKVVQEDAPNKKVYHITDSGRDALREWLKQPVSLEQLRVAWLAKLFFGHHTELLHAINNLRFHQDEVQRRMTALQQSIEQQVSNGAFEGENVAQTTTNLLTMHYIVQIQRLKNEWLARAIDALEQVHEAGPESQTVGEQLLAEIMVGLADAAE